MLVYKYLNLKQKYFMNGGAMMDIEHDNKYSFTFKVKISHREKIDEELKSYKEEYNTEISEHDNTIIIKILFDNIIKYANFIMQSYSLVKEIGKYKFLSDLIILFKLYL